MFIAINNDNKRHIHLLCCMIMGIAPGGLMLAGIICLQASLLTAAWIFHFELRLRVSLQVCFVWRTWLQRSAAVQLAPGRAYFEWQKVLQGSSPPISLELPKGLSSFNRKALSYDATVRRIHAIVNRFLQNEMTVFLKIILIYCKDLIRHSLLKAHFVLFHFAYITKLISWQTGKVLISAGDRPAKVRRGSKSIRAQCVPWVGFLKPRYKYGLDWSNVLVSLCAAAGFLSLIWASAGCEICSFTGNGWPDCLPHDSILAPGVGAVMVTNEHRAWVGHTASLSLVNLSHCQS